MQMTEKDIEAIRLEWDGVRGTVPLQKFAMKYIPALLATLAAYGRAREQGGVNEDALRALAQAYDREDAAQRGEPDPWNLDDPGDIGDSDTWVSERLACARAAAEAFLSALEPAAPEGRQEDGHNDADGYPYEYTRPSEQAVTDEMVEAAAKSLRPDLFTPIKADVLQSDDYALTCRRNAKIDVMGKARAALKAAMEAGGKKDG